MVWLYANNAEGTLAANLGASDTQLQLSPSQYLEFPIITTGGDSFFITLTDVATHSEIEICLVTATSTNVFTITRAQDGTTEQAWPAGTIVSARTVAEEAGDYLSKTFGGVIAGACEFQSVITADANIECAAIVEAAGFNVTSDYRAKEEIEAETAGLAAIRQLWPVTYELRDLKGKRHGFIAHEIAHVLPELVKGEQGGEKMQSVDYVQLIPIMVRAMQELSNEVESLRRQLGAQTFALQNATRH